MNRLVEVARDERRLVTVIAAYCAVALIAAGPSRRVFAYLAFVGVGALVTAWVHGRWRVGRSGLWAIAALGLVHLVSGLVNAPGGAGTLYQWWVVPEALRLDQVVHFLGTAAVALAAWQAARHLDPRRRVRVAMATAIAAGLVNEAVEFLLTRGAATNVGDLENTMWDLVFNLAGATVVLLVVSAPRERQAGRRARTGMVRSIAAVLRS